MVGNSGACRNRLSWTGLVTMVFFGNIEWVLACQYLLHVLMPNSLVFDFMQSYGKFLIQQLTCFM